jgi:hypothetical protein
MYWLSIRRIWLALLVLVGGTLLASGAVAHHGWGWATDEQFVLTGKITKVRLGNPHGEVMLTVDDETWVVEVGQPWRNERAGLTETLLRIGQVITAHGHRSSKADERLMKAERVVINGETYNLYPGRES